MNNDDIGDYLHVVFVGCKLKCTLTACTQNLRREKQVF